MGDILDMSGCPHEMQVLLTCAPHAGLHLVYDHECARLVAEAAYLLEELIGARDDAAFPLQALHLLDSVTG